MTKSSKFEQIYKKIDINLLKMVNGKRTFYKLTFGCINTLFFFVLYNE